jgi:hypothetical protein
MAVRCRGNGYLAAFVPDLLADVVFVALPSVWTAFAPVVLAGFLTFFLRDFLAGFLCALDVLAGLAVDLAALATFAAAEACVPVTAFAFWEAAGVAAANALPAPATTVNAVIPAIRLGLNPFNLLMLFQPPLMWDNFSLGGKYERK